MATKLRVSVGDITLDVEGEDATVLEIYHDFKASLAERFGSKSARKTAGEDEAETEADDEVGATPAKTAKRKSVRRRAASSNGEKRAESYTPTLDKSLKTSGVREFYAQYQPKSHPEKVLLFVEWLKQQGHGPCTADQIFTCYQAAGIPRPKAFKQAIIDAHGKRFGYIDYKTVTDISTTTIGEDYMQFQMTKAA